MSVRVKVAQTARELDDVFQLRHKVYVEQEGVFKGEGSGDSRSVFNRFDALFPVANIIAYSGEEAVGTLRINLDTGAKLPADELYDFTQHREAVTEEWMEQCGELPRFVGAGMLAISHEWRRRSDVLLALFKMAAGIASSWGSTHIIATVNSKTSGMYRRCGFKSLDEPQWIEKIGDHITPMVGLFADYYNWAFGDIMENKKFLNAYAESFQRLILGGGETLFQEGDEGHEVYIIDDGAIRISQRTKESREAVTLATFGRGDMFGELALIDAKPRSAWATALATTELITLDRKEFINGLNETRLWEMVELLAARIRRADELIAALHGSAVQRMKHTLDDIRVSAVPDSKRPGTHIVKFGLLEFINSAGVTESEARDYLEEQKEKGFIEYTDRRIRFLPVEKV